MEAVQVIPTHGFWVECGRVEFLEMVARNRIASDNWGGYYFLSEIELFEKPKGDLEKYGFFLGLDGSIELGDQESITSANGRQACGMQSFRFSYLADLVRHHRVLLRDPNVQKSIFASSTKIPTRIVRNQFCGYSEFSSLSSVPRGSYVDWSDDTLAWEIIRQMEYTDGNEANFSTDLEVHWFERRDHYISINPKTFPSFDVTLSELKARKARANQHIAELYHLVQVHGHSESGDLAARNLLEKLDDDAVLEICFVDYHGAQKVTKTSGDVFLQRLPNTELLFN